MSIRPVDFNGMIQSNQDVSNVKSREDSVGTLLNQNATAAIEENVEARSSSVEGRDNVAENDTDSGGSGAGYAGDGGRGREKKKKRFESDGEVRFKGMSGGFNITI